MRVSQDNDVSIVIVYFSVILSYAVIIHWNAKNDGLWEECIQEETRVANREALLARDDDQALATHTKGGRKKSYFQKETHKESHPQNKSQPKRFQKKGQWKERDYSFVQCYHCEKMGHIARHCPARREEYKRKNKRHHAHAVEYEEPPAKMLREQIKDCLNLSPLKIGNTWRGHLAYW